MRNRANAIAGGLSALIFSAFAASAVSAADADLTADGAKLFKQRCAVCHAVEASKQKPTGPHLEGVIGRKIGSAEGARYSKGYLESDIVWDAATLDTYLANPRKMIKGSRMTVRVKKEDQRAALIAYLKTL